MSSSFQDIVEDIRDSARLASDDEAALMLMQTLASFTEQLTSDEAERVADSLPEPLPQIIRDVDGRSAPGDEFDIARFFGSVAARDHTSPGMGREHAIIVCAALGRALPRETLHRLVRHLGPDARALLEDRVFVAAGELEASATSAP